MVRSALLVASLASLFCLSCEGMGNIKEKLEATPEGDNTLDFYTQKFLKHSSDGQFQATDVQGIRQAKFMAYKLSLMERRNTIAAKQLEATQQLNQLIAQLVDVKPQATASAPVHTLNVVAGMYNAQAKPDDSKNSGK